MRLPLAEAVVSANETVSATCTPDLRFFSFNGWFSSSVRDVNEGLSVVAFALRPSLLLSSRPRRRSLPRCWCGGSSFPREWGWSPVCNGTLLRARCNSFEY
jgi:hypothetical protein